MTNHDFEISGLPALRFAPEADARTQLAVPRAGNLGDQAQSVPMGLVATFSNRFITTEQEWRLGIKRMLTGAEY